MADDWDPGANATPFGPQGGSSPTPAAEEYDPGGPRKPPSPLTHAYQNGAPIDIPAMSYEFPGGDINVPREIAGMISGNTSVKRPEVPFLTLPVWGLA